MKTSLLLASILVLLTACGESKEESTNPSSSSASSTASTQEPSKTTIRGNLIRKSCDSHYFPTGYQIFPISGGSRVGDGSPVESDGSFSLSDIPTSPNSQTFEVTQCFDKADPVQSNLTIDISTSVLDLKVDPTTKDKLNSKCGPDMDCDDYVAESNGGTDCKDNDAKVFRISLTDMTCDSTSSISERVKWTCACPTGCSALGKSCAKSNVTVCGYETNAAGMSNALDVGISAGTACTSSSGQTFYYSCTATMTTCTCPSGTTSNSSCQL